MHALHVCGQRLLGLPSRMNGMHRMQFDHAGFDLLHLVIRVLNRFLSRR